MSQPNLLKKLSTKIVTTACLACSLTLLTAQLCQAELPELGSPDLVHYDPQTEEAFGRAFTSTLHTQYDLNYDPETITYIRRIGHKVASELGQARHFRFYVINDPAINAFAGPNGIIGIHTGLILAAKSEDELASVIAHEIAHITQRHLSRRLEYQAKQGSTMQFATILAAILIGAYDPAAIAPILMAGSGISIEQQLKHSRQHESEADSVGITLVQKSGYDPHAMGSFFGRLALESQYQTFKVPEILRSHPVTESRIAEAENRASNMSKALIKPYKNTLKLIQMRLQNQMTLTNKANFSSTALSESERCYQSSLKLLNTRNSRFNLNCIKQYAKETPEQAIYSNLLFEIIAKTDKVTRDDINFATNLAEFQAALNPNNIAVLIRYSQLLVNLNQHEKAIKLLTENSHNAKYQFLTHRLLAETYANKKLFAYSYYFYASSQFNIGNIEATQYFLEQAEKQNNQSDKLLTRKITLLSNISNNLLNSNKKDQ